MMKLLKIIMLALISISSLIGCQNNLRGPQQTIKLKVAALDTHIDEKILQTYQVIHPEVEFEVVSCEFQKRDEVLAQGIDIVAARTGNFHQLAKEGKLKSLEEFAKKELSTDELEPSLQKVIRNLGEGTIYGVATSFTSRGIVCNVDLFQKADIAIPEKRMAWEEFFELGKQLTQKLKTPAIIFSDYFYKPHASQFLKVYSEALNLRMFNPHTKKLELNHAGWKEMFKKTMGLIEDGVLESPENLESDLFFESGESPMMIAEYDLFSRLITNPKLNIRAMPMPYNAQAPHVNAGLELHTLFAIVKGSAHEKESQEFLKFLSSEIYAKHFDIDYYWGPRIKINKQKQNYQEFVQGEFLGVTDMMRLWEKFPEVASSIESSLSSPIDLFIKGKVKTLDEAVDSFSRFCQTKLEESIAQEGRK